MKKGVSYTLLTLSIVIVALSAVSVDIIGILETLGAIGGTGVVNAFAASAVTGEPVTTKNTREKSPDLQLDAISQKIVQMKPSRTALHTITMYAPKKTIKSFKSDYYAVDTRGFKDTVAATYTKPADGAELASIEVADIGLWVKDDTILVKSITGTDGKALALYVSDTDKANSIVKVQALNGPNGTNANADTMIVPTINSGTVIHRMGTAKSELDAQHDAYGIIPQKEHNYVQLFMAMVEESFYSRTQEKEVNWSFTDKEALNVYDMKAGMEASYIWGVRRQFNDVTDTEETYTTGGAYRYIDNLLEYGSGGTDRTIDRATYVNWMKKIFLGNSGSETRVLLAGGELLGSLHLVDEVAKQINAQNTLTKFGITFKRIVTNYGQLLVLHHPMFDIMGYGEDALVMDPANIEKHVRRALNTYKLDLKKPGIRLSDANVIAETSCLAWRYPDTHAWISPKA